MREVSVIIPAYNEAPRISRVLEAVIEAPEVEEILVVDDGSTDNTAEVAASYGAEVIRLPANQGKGKALCVGAAAARSPYLLFLDADLVGLRPEHITALLEPVLAGRADMTVSIRGEEKAWLWYGPEYSGERAMHRDFFAAAVNVCEQRYGAEKMLNQYAHETGAQVEYVYLHGVSSPLKINKWGFLAGLSKALSDMAQRSPVSQAVLIAGALAGGLVLIGKGRGHRG